MTEISPELPEEAPPPLDRRNFLAKAGLLAGASLAIDGRRFVSAASSATDEDPTTEAATADPRSTLIAKKHMRIIDLEVDVLIAGGGMAGVCAALAAARNGANTLLIQDRSRLGGNASSEIGMHIVGADVHGGRSGWREGGLIEEIRLEDARRNPHRAFELFDLTLYDLCQREERLTLKLDTSIYSAEVREGKITRVQARCDKTETIYRIEAGIYCDCTGDCRLGLEAGAEFRTGREPRAQYNESLALEKGDKNSQGSTILFTATKHENPIDFIAPPWARKMTENDFLFRKIPDRKSV
ncbi:MAG: FAD-dependent oxidoreductase, partial [Planctomycetota bacterium]